MDDRGDLCRRLGGGTSAWGGERGVCLWERVRDDVRRDMGYILSYAMAVTSRADIPSSGALKSQRRFPFIVNKTSLDT